MANVLALVRSWWCNICIGQEIDEFSLDGVKGPGNSQVKYVSNRLEQRCSNSYLPSYRLLVLLLLTGDSHRERNTCHNRH